MAKVMIEMTGNEAKAYQAFQRLAKANATVEKGFQKTADASKKSTDKISRNMNKAGKSAEKMRKNFGPNALGQLKSFAAGVVGITAAVQALKGAWDAVDKARTAALEKAEGAQMGMESLVQLAGSKGQLQKLQAAAVGLYRAGAAPSMEAAAGTVFQLESAGALGSLGLFRDIYGAVADPAKLAKASATIQTSMGAKETGSYRDIVSKGLAASSFSPATVESLLESASRGGAFAKGLGVSDEALLASTALLAKSSGTAELGGTQSAAFFKALDKARLAGAGDFRGLGLAGIMDKLGGMTEEERGKALGGRAEANVAYRTIRDNSALVHEIMAAQKQGMANNLVGQRIQLARTDPFLNALRARRQSSAALAIAQMPGGLERAHSEAIIDQMQADALEAGGSEFWATQKSRYARFVRWGGHPVYSGDQLIMERYGKGNAQMSRAVNDFTENVLRSGAAIEQQARAVDSGPTLSRPDRDR